MHSLTARNISSLPDIVKREIMSPKLNDRELGHSERKKLTARIITMLGVKFTDDAEMQLAQAEFGTLLRSYSLTAQEVIEAYRMAIKKELPNADGEPIKVYPNLSTIQAGEILSAYINFKVESVAHTKGIEKLRGFLKPPTAEPTQEEKEIASRKIIDSVRGEVSERGSSEKAFLIYNYLCERKEFIPYRRKFPQAYNFCFRKFIAREKANPLLLTRYDIRVLEQGHDELVRRLSEEPKTVKVTELNGYVYQQAKNLLVVKFLKENEDLCT
ncbi:hypothetical protein SAMN05443429_11252 [Cruoricaptor ignavus]|uniref:Uncharacterized protein n=1 Tax=Cruoricaptor ignavus TaxID=1118202 RepID=A0A1M6HGC6_9FLAO|nr:hypothetical protein SAMN05443429_11252 [Cruoricaptor ignavus]